MTKCKLEVTKNTRNWGTSLIVERPGWPATTTNSGHPTLASALWHAVGDLSMWSGDVSLDSVTVKDKPMSSAEVYNLIEHRLAGGIMESFLPRYKRFLGIA